MNKKEKEKALRGATWSGARTKDGKKIMFCSENEINKRKDYVQVVLEILGHPEAWVSDLSSVGDFVCFLDTKKERNTRLRKFSKALGFKVEEKDLIWEVAKRLQKEEITALALASGRIRRVAKDGRKLPQKTKKDKKTKKRREIGPRIKGFYHDRIITGQ